MAPSSSSSGTRTRRYDGSGRQAQARASRRRVVEAAQRLFLDQGYGATSLDEIADEAGVSTPTVYAKFGSKAGLLKAIVDVSVVGDDEDVALLDRPEVQERLAIEPLSERLRALCEYTEQVHRRSADVWRLAARVSGAEPAAGALIAEIEGQIREVAAAYLDAFPASTVRPELDREAAVDLMALYGHPQTWCQLVRDAGWSGEQYVDWLAGALGRTVIDLGQSPQSTQR